MQERIPAFIAAVCIAIYWAAVVVKLIKLGRKIGKSPNALPREHVGRLMRLAWYPAILLQLAHAWWIALGGRWPYAGGLLLDLPFGQPPLPPAWWLALAYGAVLVIVLCTALTFICWRKMGRSWRIGIDPSERLDLVSTGPYRYVRHPIYALRMVLDGGVILAIPTPFMAVVTLIDILLLQIEARREESYMESKHGAIYAQYKKNVGRFVPCRRVV
jgi:protein-S-isoprenylcysteine O-methyltransferase Ste14